MDEDNKLDNPAHAAAITLHFFDSEKGYPAGDFASVLIRAMCRADGHNLARLMTAYPVLGAAVSVAKYQADGLAMLEQSMKGEAA